MTTNVLKISLGVPAYGSMVHAGHIRMWAEIGNTIGASPDRFQLTDLGYVDLNGIDRARNWLLAKAFKLGADWLVMIDADTWIESVGAEDAGFQLARMVSDADRAGAIIVGAPVARRGAERHEVMVYRGDPRSSKPGQLEPISVEELGRGLKPVDALATAVFAVKITAIGECRFKFTDELSEDLDFCAQVRNHAALSSERPFDSSRQGPVPILVDTRVNTRHLSRPVAIGPLKLNENYPSTLPRVADPTD